MSIVILSDFWLHPAITIISFLTTGSKDGSTGKMFQVVEESISRLHLHQQDVSSHLVDVVVPKIFTIMLKSATGQDYPISHVLLM